MMVIMTWLLMMVTMKVIISSKVTVTETRLHAVLFSNG